MKVNELLTGVWVSYNDPWNNIRNGKIVTIDEEKRVVFFEGKIACYLEEQLQPIPLSSLFFEGNNFYYRCRRGDEYWTNSDNSIKVEEYGDKFKITIDVRDEDGDLNYIVKFCKYVHEYQCVLKSMGINNEVAL